MGVIYEVKVDQCYQRRLQKFRRLFRLHPCVGKQTYFATHMALEFCRQKDIPVTVLHTSDSQASGISIVRPFPVIIMVPPTGDAIDEVIALALSKEKEGKLPVVVYLGRGTAKGNEEGAFILDRPGSSRKYTWRFVSSLQEVQGLDIRSLFPKFLSLVHDTDSKFILSLGGGGLKTYAHGCIFRFLDTLEVKDCIDEIWGTSAGAISGLWYASDVPVEEMLQSGYDMYNERFSLLLSPSKLRVLKNLIVHNLLPVDWRPSGFSGFIEAAKSIHNFIQKVKKDRALHKPFFCVAFNIQDFKADVLTPEKVDSRLYNEGIYTVDAIEAAVASSSVPVLFVPPTIKRADKEVTYIDGGVTERLPLRSIYEKWARERSAGIEKRKKLFILAVKLLPHNIIGMPVEKKVGELQIALMYQSAMVHAIIGSHRALLAQDSNVTLWELSAPLNNLRNFDIKSIPSFVKLSYEHLPPQLLELEAKQSR